VVFIETPVFTKQVLELLSDYDYSDFQHYLAQNPEVGDVIKNTGGLRKIRWKTKGKGKSGGVRVIYFYVPSVIQIRLLLIYKKGIKDDLTSNERKVLRSINANW
jgi:mRNA-degrading endonuclease RelE of RelBE toxin-antitoxin system